MFPSNSSSLAPPNNNSYNNKNNQYLCPAYSCDHLLAPPGPYPHYKSEPNVALFFDNQGEQRRLSDGPHPTSTRRPYSYHYYHHPNEFNANEGHMLKRKNSSINMLLDSTSSMMRTASTTVQCFLGSARRASYCGQPDPSVQLAPNGVSGSLYLRSATANSNESSLSNLSYDEQKRRVTIYDGRVPTTPVTPTIPFELMTPLEAITKAVDDPLESFVQIVLEKPDDKPPIMPPVPSTPPHVNYSNRRRHRSSSPRYKTNYQRPTDSIENSALPKLVLHQSMPTRDQSNSNGKHHQTSLAVEPMDFSFLEPVLRNDNIAPPASMRNHSLSSLNKRLTDPGRISLNTSSATEDSAVDLHSSSRSSYSSNYVINVEDDLASPDSLSDDNHHYYMPHFPRPQVTPFME